MTWFTIFATLLIVQSGISDVVIYGELRRSVKLSASTEVLGEIKNCVIETNIGDKYMFSPGVGSMGDRNVTIIANYLDCSVLLYLPSAEFAGEWKITSYFQEDNHPPVTNKFKIIVKKETRVVPDYIWINTDYFIHAELDLNGKNVTNCTLLTPTSQEIDLLNDGTKNLRRFGRCGFRALVNDKSQNIWKLKAFVEEDKIFYTGGVDVNVFNKEKKTEEEITITLNLGTSGTVSLPVYRTIIFCQLEDPMGLKTPFFDSCVYHIPVVTPRHQGVWIARYGGMEHPVPTVQRFRVVTRDPVSSGSNVIVTENKEIRLSCHIYDEVPMSFKFCHFVRPDEYVLNLRNGIGTEGYSSFNTFEANNTHIYCGLIIHEPKQHDYGAWKCNVKLQGNRYRGSIIYVDPRIMSRNETQNATREFHIVTENVYVKRNDFFQIKCTVDAVLDYCWFRSPNGTFYTVIPNQRQSPANLFYVGLGFNFGDCVAAIDRASYTDHGEWTCNVGIVDGPEESKTVLVNVTESYVIPERTELVANYKEDTILSCNILPNITDKDIHYCRWVRPDGHGIHHSLGPRYTTNRSNTGCKLMIADCDTEKDIGRWTCVFGLRGLEDEEASATISNLTSTCWCIWCLTQAGALDALIFRVLTLHHSVPC
ncbi:uncharacterized protein LOC114874137 isoform X2 [Osmia bicornis bicornis]|uniref:uncharacterized protein LOC114874137 isoform X2 n=1 Tax=Osmia bicornis bicornis TaxID=1437191 RepID=UPI001EAF268B|nr:uncharacterized protein LOC114874137 isoform X2 [Osmia bicornis bicornis]